MSNALSPTRGRLRAPSVPPVSAAPEHDADWATLIGAAHAALQEVPLRRAYGELTTVGAHLASTRLTKALVACWRAVAASDVISIGGAARSTAGTPAIVEAAVAAAAVPWWSTASSRTRRAVAPQLDDLARRAGQIFAATVAQDSEDGDYAARRAMEAVAVALARGNVAAADPALPRTVSAWPLAYGAILGVAVDAGTFAWEWVEAMLFGPRKVFVEEAGFGVSRTTARVLLLTAAEEHLLWTTCRCHEFNPDGRRPPKPCDMGSHRLDDWDPANVSLFNWYVTFWRGSLKAGTNDNAQKAIADGGLRKMILGNLRNPGQWATTSRPARYALRAGEKLPERCDSCGGRLIPPRQQDEADLDPRVPRRNRQHDAAGECDADTAEAARYHGVTRGLILEPPERLPDEAAPRSRRDGAPFPGGDRERDRRLASGVVVTVESVPLGFELGHPVWLMKDGTIQPSERPGERLPKALKDELGVAQPYARVWAYLPKGSAHRAFARDLERVQQRLDEQRSVSDVDLADFPELRIIHKVSRQRGSLVVKRADLGDVVAGWLALLEIPEAIARIEELCTAEPSGPSPAAVKARVLQFAAWLGLIDDDDEETAP